MKNIVNSQDLSNAADGWHKSLICFARLGLTYKQVLGPTIKLSFAKCRYDEKKFKLNGKDFARIKMALRVFWNLSFQDNFIILKNSYTKNLTHAIAARNENQMEALALFAP